MRGLEHSIRSSSIFGRFLMQFYARVGEMGELIRTHLILCYSAPSPRPLPQAGGEGKGEGELLHVKRKNALVLFLLTTVLLGGLLLDGCERQQAPPPPPVPEAATATAQPQQTALPTD